MPVSTDLPMPKKRKAQYIGNITSQARPKRRRIPLQSVSNNIAGHCIGIGQEIMSASSAKRGRGGYGASGPKTPRRSRRKTPTAQPNPPSDEEYEDERVDADPTPRGPSLPERALPPPSSGSSTRSKSPVKMVGLKNIQGGLEYHIIQSNAVLDDESHPLYSVRGVIEALDEISQGIAVIPLSHSERLREPKHRREFYAHHFDDSGKRDSLGTAPDISQVEELVARTIECEQEQESEGGWNCDVQWPTARLALDHSVHKNRLQLKNM